MYSLFAFWNKCEIILSRNLIIVFLNSKIEAVPFHSIFAWFQVLRCSHRIVEYCKVDYRVTTTLPRYIQTFITIIDSSTVSSNAVEMPLL